MTYPTGYSVDMNINGTYYRDQFAGNFTTAASGAVTGGTVSLYEEYIYSPATATWNLTASLTNFSYSAVDVYNAALSGSQNPTLYIEAAVMSGNDGVYGSTGNDILYGGIGNDLINGGGGVDTAEYMGPRSDYSISRNADGSISVVDDGSPYHDGSDTLYGISYLQFSDQTDAISSLFSPSSAGGNQSIAVQDTTLHQSLSPSAQTYAGPVAGIQNQYINAGTDGLNITASTPNWFIHSGGGNDAIAVSGGTNVLDGGTGSNFLTGGSGTDTFFVDDRNAPADIWSTVNNFHAGDSATIWGVTSQDHSLDWADSQGAAGYQGLTLHATAPGAPIASLTLVGFSQSDLNDGRLSVSFGSSNGSSYMYVHDNS